MKRNVPAYIASLLLVFLAFTLLTLGLGALFEAVKGEEDTPPLPVSLSPSPTVVLDPGHGGKDGGAVSLTGTAEKTLNLLLCYDLRDLLEASGVRVVMTREKDGELTVSDPSAGRKMNDLRGREEVMRANPDAVFVSIHMNKFPDGRYSGTQIFCAKGSESLASLIRESVVSSLQKDNAREIKTADGSIYLLDRARVPAVLVECGFLSNREEAEKLETESYRLSLACAIARGILLYFQNEGIPK